MSDPMYRQIAEDLMSRISTGEWGPGSRLPTEIELRERYHASRNTVRDALQWLLNRKLIEIRPGRGTYVPDLIDPFEVSLVGPNFGAEGVRYASDAAAQQREARIEPPRVEVQNASERLAEALRIEPGTPVVCRHQERYIDRKPWSLQSSFYPMSFVQRGATLLLQATDIEIGVVAYLREQLGIEQVGCIDALVARLADAGEIKFFKILETAVIVEQRRTGYDSSGTPMRYTVTVYPADRNRLKITWGDVPRSDQVPDDADLGEPEPAN